MRESPAREDHAAQHTAGEREEAPVPICIADYDPQWPQQFELEASAIRSVLGARVLRLEHAGSTAVPGLAAKAVIDIVLEVADSAAEAEYVPALEEAGYKLRIRESGWYEHRMFTGSRGAVNLHVFSARCPEIERMLLFRNWLRTHPDDRELYARTKRALAQKNWKHVQNYADAKSGVVAEIMARAEVAKPSGCDRQLR